MKYKKIVIWDGSNSENIYDIEGFEATDLPGFWTVRSVTPKYDGIVINSRYIIKMIPCTDDKTLGNQMETWLDRDCTIEVL